MASRRRTPRAAVVALRDRAASPVNRLLVSVAGVRIVPARRGTVDLHGEWFTRLLHLARLIERVRGVPGDVVECGVASGVSLAMLASLVRESGEPRLVWGFDSWAGLPPPRTEDLADDGSIAEAGMFAWATRARVIAELHGHGFEDAEIAARVRLVEGPFAETLPRFAGGAIVILHVDADLYESYRIALEALWPRLSVGGIAAFDEYEQPELWPGPRRAVDEFLARLAPGAAELERDERSGKWCAVKRS